MNNIERIRELIRDLERGCDKMSGGLNLEQMRRMLVVSECITASIQAYLFKFMTGYTEDKSARMTADKPAKPIPPFFSRGPV